MTENRAIRVAAAVTAAALLALFGAPDVAKAQSMASAAAGESTPSRSTPWAPSASLPDEPLSIAAAGAASAARAEEQLVLSFRPYAWLTSLDGTAGAAGVETDVDATFLDLLDQSDTLYGFMGEIDLEYKRLVFTITGSFTHAGFSGERGKAVSGPGGGGLEVEVDSDLEINSSWHEVFGGYRFIDAPIGEDAETRLTLDGFIGGRITTMELDLDVTSEQQITLRDGRVLEAGVERSLDEKEGWFEPFVGAQVGLQPIERLAVIVRGDIGGFDVDDSELAWQALGAIGYRWHMERWTLGLFGGYRAIGQDYSRGGFVFDMVTHGPILGATFAFPF
jgi:hypothetical protein